MTYKKILYVLSSLFLNDEFVIPKDLCLIDIKIFLRYTEHYSKETRIFFTVSLKVINLISLTDKEKST